MAKILIFSKDNCPYCVRAMGLLDSKGASYEVKKITDGAHIMKEFLTLTNGAKTVPQIFINEKLVGGFTDLAALDGNGELDKMLAL